MLAVSSTLPFVLDGDRRVEPLVGSPSRVASLPVPRSPGMFPSSPSSVESASVTANGDAPPSRPELLQVQVKARGNPQLRRILPSPPASPRRISAPSPLHRSFDAAALGEAANHRAADAGALSPISSWDDGDDDAFDLDPPLSPPTPRPSATFSFMLAARTDARCGATTPAQDADKFHERALPSLPPLSVSDGPRRPSSAARLETERGSEVAPQRCPSRERDQAEIARLMSFKLRGAIRGGGRGTGGRTEKDMRHVAAFGAHRVSKGKKVISDERRVDKPEPKLKSILRSTPSSAEDPNLIPATPPATPPTLHFLLPSPGLCSPIEHAQRMAKARDEGLKKLKDAAAQAGTLASSAPNSSGDAPAPGKPRLNRAALRTCAALAASAAQQQQQPTVSHSNAPLSPVTKPRVRAASGATPVAGARDRSMPSLDEITARITARAGGEKKIDVLAGAGAEEESVPNSPATPTPDVSVHILPPSPPAHPPMSPSIDAVLGVAGGLSGTIVVADAGHLAPPPRLAAPGAASRWAKMAGLADGSLVPGSPTLSSIRRARGNSAPPSLEAMRFPPKAPIPGVVVAAAGETEERERRKVGSEERATAAAAAAGDDGVDGRREEAGRAMMLRLGKRRSAPVPPRA